VTFDELLGELLRLVGREVIVSVTAVGAIPQIPVASLSGPLRKAAPAASQETSPRTAQAASADEALVAHLGRADDSTETNYFRVRKSDLRAADWLEGAFGERFLLIDLRGVSITLVTRGR
jgi:hypothetical protein